MSSIINALKKLEKEALEKSQDQSLPLKSPTKKSMYQRLKQSRLFNKRFFLVAILVLIAGGWLILSRTPREKAPALVAKTQIPPAKPINPPKRSEHKISVPHSTHKHMPIPKEAKKPEPVANPAGSPALSSHTPREKAPARIAKTQITTAKPISLPKPPEHKVSVPDLPQKQTPVQTLTKTSEHDTTSQRFASLSLKHSSESGLQLQAIAWSGDAKSRMAVINGHIIREKESIDGTVVRYIGKDYIVFENGAEVWRQMFRVK